jgi:hypothetical protein
MLRRTFICTCGPALMLPSRAPAQSCPTANCLDGNVGCAIDPDSSERFGRETNQIPASGNNLIGTSDIRNFDQALGRVLSRLSRRYGVTPGFAYYREAGRDRGAHAHAGTEVASTSGTVLFGLNMLEYQIGSARYGDMAILAICAHEFGHIRQFRHQSEMRQALRGECCYRTELHADFLAGWGLWHYLDEFSSTHGLQDVGRAWAALGSGSFNNPGTHGTPSQRVSAIEAGYRYASVDPARGVMSAMNAGITHVKGG